MHEAKRLGALTGIEFSKGGVAVTLIFTMLSAILFPLYIMTKSTTYVILASIAMSGLLYALLNPIVQRQNNKINIDGSIPFFITAFATLSVSGADRVQILGILAGKEKLGYINKELKKIVNLTKNWKMSLGEIANFLAERTPSDLFADFLSRLGQATDSGQNFDEFLTTETNTVMANYENNYVSALYSFDLFKDMYISMLLAFAFMIAFIMIMPILIPVDMNVMMILAVLAMAMGESMIVVGIKTVLPYDPIWQRTGIKTNTETVLRIWFIGFGAISSSLLAIFFLTPYFISIPFYLLFAIAITPLAVPSIIGSNTEKEIMKK
ncbi:MAG: type II secretion system F family protein, partial [Thermoplasmataceae archaeon]